MAQGEAQCYTEDFPPTPLPAPSGATEHEVKPWADLMRHILSKEDCCLLISEVKTACTEEINMFRKDFKHLSNKVDLVDEDLQETETQMVSLRTQVTSKAIALCESQRHIDDLDNRGRQNNIRLRGLPEAT